MSLISKLPKDLLDLTLEFVGKKTFLPLHFKYANFEFKISKKNNTYELKKYIISYDEDIDTEALQSIPLEAEYFQIDGKENLINFLINDIKIFIMSIKINFPITFEFKDSLSYDYWFDTTLNETDQFIDIKKIICMVVDLIGIIYLVK